MHLTVTSLQCHCLSWLMIERGNLWKPKPTKFQTHMKKRPRSNGETCVTILSSRMAARIQGNFGGWRNSITGKPILLMKPLSNRPSRDVRIWVNTMFKIARCERTKITRAPCRRRNGEAVPRAVNFGDLITADHKVLSDICESRNNHRYAVVVQDLATQWIQAYPCKNKTSQETQRSLQKFLEPERKPKVIYTNNYLEFGKACEDLLWNTSIRLMVLRKEHLCCIVAIRSNESWWANSMECYTCLRNVTNLLSDGKTYERRCATIQRTYYSIWSIGSVSPSNCEGSVPHPSIWKESFTWIVPRIRSVRGWNLEGWHIGCSTLRSWKRWAHQNSTRKDSMRSDISQTRRIYFSNRTQMGESKHPEEIRSWEHPPWYGLDQFKKRVILIFLEN